MQYTGKEKEKRLQINHYL